MKLLVTGAWGNGVEQLDKLRELGNDPVFMQNEKDGLPIAPEEIEGVVCNGLFLYHDIKKFSSLRYIQLTSAGFDRVPLDYIKEKGIKIFNARGVYSIPMAEYAVWGVLSLYKRARFFESNRKERKWDKHREVPEIFGKTVAIVGCGSVGRECAKRFSAFGCNLTGVDLYGGESDIFEKVYPIDKIDKVLNFADVVVLTLPLTEKTEGLFSEERFSAMKEGSVLVNVSRGAIVDERALINALKGRLFGAVLDVFVTEPLESDSELWGLDNALVTPHNSFVGENNKERLSKVIVDNLKEEMYD